MTALPGEPQAAPPHAHALDSTSDHGASLNVIAWCLGAITGLIVACRLAMKSILSRSLAADDYFILLAYALAMGQSGALSAAITNGFGLVTKDPTNIDAQEKAMYAFNILFVLSQCAAKCSTAMFILLITPVSLHRHLCKTVIGCSCLWALVSTFVFAFQCQLPQPWMGPSTRCIDQSAASASIGVLNILLDGFLVSLPVIIFWTLQQRVRRRIWIIITFSSRVVVIIATIAQIVVVFEPQQEGTFGNPFLTRNYALTTQIVEYLSVIAACGPSLKPFLGGLSSGMIASDDLARRAASTVAHSTHQGSGVKKLSFSTIQLQKLHPKIGGNEVTITAEAQQGSTHNATSWDNASQESTSRIIRQTTTYEVTHESLRR